MPEDQRPHEPQLPDWLFWIWRAWHTLTHERAWIGGGMGPAAPGRIPWSAVMLYCDRLRYGEEDRLLLTRGVAAMDEAFLEWWQEDAARRAQAAKR